MQEPLTHATISRAATTCKISSTAFIGAIAVCGEALLNSGRPSVASPMSLPPISTLYLCLSSRIHSRPCQNLLPSAPKASLLSLFIYIYYGSALEDSKREEWDFQEQLHWELDFYFNGETIEAEKQVDEVSNTTCRISSNIPKPTS